MLSCVASGDSSGSDLAAEAGASPGVIDGAGAALSSSVGFCDDWGDEFGEDEAAGASPLKEGREDSTVVVEVLDKCAPKVTLSEALGDRTVEEALEMVPEVAFNSAAFCFRTWAVSTRL